MGIADEQVQNLQGLTLHTVTTEQYKTNTIVLKMKAPLTADQVTYRSLLPQVLQSSTAEYPSTTSLRAYLDDLYGASFYGDASKKGEYDIISFTLEIANEKFLRDPAPLLERAFSFLAEVLFRPNAAGGAFHEQTFQNEKRALKQRIQSVYDDKMRYASTRLTEEMCKGEPYALDPLGSISQLENITADRLFSYYKEALETDQMDLYVVGAVSPEEVQALAEKYFKVPARKDVRVVPVQKEPREPKEVIDQADVKQGKLNIGYRTGIVYGDEDYYALQVFNGVFGGFSHSKLFINVREKASLAYYAASRIESHKGLMIVMSGIEAGNFRQALTIIEQQLEEMKQGRFTDDDLEQTKAVIRNQLLETIDSPRGLIEMLYHNAAAGTSISLDQWLERTGQVTKDQVIKAAGKIQLDTVYFLTGKEVQQ